MLKMILFLITLYGSHQIHAQSSHPRSENLTNVSVTPGIRVKPQDAHTTTMDLLNTSLDVEANTTLPVTAARRINSRGPMDSDGTINTTPLNPRSFPNTPVRVDDIAHRDIDLHDNGETIINSNTSENHSRDNELNAPVPNSTVNIGITTHTINVNNGTTTELILNINPSTPVPSDVVSHRIPGYVKPLSTPEYPRTTEDTVQPSHEDGGHHRSETHMEPAHLEDDKTDSSGDINRNLCLSCLCDLTRENVYCKHEHLSHGQSHHLKLRANLIPKTATTLHIQDFDKVTITKGTFASQDSELRQIHFENIGDLVLTKGSLHFNESASSNREVALIIEKCNIKEMPEETLTQHARSVDQNSDIDLEDTRFVSLHIERCNITTIRSYALTRARLLYFKMSYTKVEQMEEHSFHVDAYEDWTMEHSQLPRLIGHTICLRAQKLVVFSHNYFAGLENRSLEITSSTQVLFEFNRVMHLGSEALLGIVPEGRGSNMVFLNNTLFNLENQSLVISRKYPMHERKILDNSFNIQCDCDIKETFRPLMGMTDRSDHIDNQTFIAVMESSSCRRYAASNIYSNIENYVSENCAPLPLPIIVSAAVVGTVIVITIIVCIVCSKRAEKAKEEANYLGECCYSHSFSTLNSGTGNQTVETQPFSECGSWEKRSNLQPWVMAVPEVRTYQETEVNVHYEHTDPLNASIRGSYQEPVIDFERKTHVRASCPFN